MGEAINQAGWIAGNYVDSNNIMHGFLRNPHGRVTEFAVPGANGYYGAWVDGAAGINWAGVKPSVKAARGWRRRALDPR